MWPNNRPVTPLLMALLAKASKKATKYSVATLQARQTYAVTQQQWLTAPGSMAAQAARNSRPLSAATEVEGARAKYTGLSELLMSSDEFFSAQQARQALDQAPDLLAMA